MIDEGKELPWWQTELHTNQIKEFNLLFKFKLQTESCNVYKQSTTRPKKITHQSRHHMTKRKYQKLDGRVKYIDASRSRQWWPIKVGCTGTIDVNTNKKPWEKALSLKIQFCSRRDRLSFWACPASTLAVYRRPLWSCSALTWTLHQRDKPEIKWCHMEERVSFCMIL